LCIRNPQAFEEGLLLSLVFSLGLFSAIQLVVQTTVLTLILSLIGEGDTDPFKRDGFRSTVLRCFGTCSVTTTLWYLSLSVAPFGHTIGVLLMTITIGIWFGAVMILFEKSWLGALLIAVSVFVVSLLMSVGLGYLSDFFILP